MNNRTTPSVSVIIPVYNTERYLGQCLDSILDQSFKNLEVILIDDGSSDQSGEICDTYSNKDPRIIVRHQDNTGVSASRNSGLNQASGKYIYFMDADDILCPDAINTMVQAAEKSNTDCVRMGYRVLYPNGEATYSDERLQPNLYFSRQSLDALRNDFIMGAINCYTPMLLIKRDLVTAIQFREGIHMMEDVIFHAELLENAKSFLVLDYTGYDYRINIASASQNPDNFLRNAYDIISVYKIITSLNTRGLSIEQLSAKYISLISNRLLAYKKNGVRLSRHKEQVFKIYDNKEFKKMIEKADFNSLPIQTRASAWAFAYKHFHLLMFTIYIRLILGHIKRYAHK